MPINVVLSGDNYSLWMQSMKQFLISKKLWKIVTGDITAPIQPIQNIYSDRKIVEIYIEQQEDWDSKNHQILTWLRNTSSQAI